VVPGMRLFSHPSPSCGICPACRSDAHAFCPDSLRRPSGPGWFSRQRVLHAWSARRGSLVLPSDLDAGAASLLEPLSVVLRLERLFPRRDRVVVVGGGLPAILAGMALEGPRRRILLGQDPDSRASERGFHAVCRDSSTARLALDGPADLVVLADGDPASVRFAAELLAPGTAVASFAAPEEAADLPARIHAVGGSWRSVVGSGPDDWNLASRRLPALADRLANLPVHRMELERAQEAAGFLDADPALLRVELS